MPGEYIKIKSKDNKEFSGYLCTSSTGRGPGLLLVQEIFGINSHIREVAELYAQDGFTVLAPDLFWRAEPGIQLSYNEKDFAKGLELYGKLDMEQAINDLSCAVDTLRLLPETTSKVGAVGYCLGGLIAYKLACRDIVDASVAYYGGGTDQALDEAKNLTRPLLMHFAEADKFIPKTAIEKIRTTLAGKSNVTIYTYPNVDHGFNCDQRGSYNRQSAMLAFARSSAFLHRWLA